MKKMCLFLFACFAAVGCLPEGEPVVGEQSSELSSDLGTSSCTPDFKKLQLKMEFWQKTAYVDAPPVASLPQHTTTRLVLTTEKHVFDRQNHCAETVTTTDSPCENDNNGSAIRSGLLTKVATIQRQPQVEQVLLGNVGYHEVAFKAACGCDCGTATFVGSNSVCEAATSAFSLACGQGGVVCNNLAMAQKEAFDGGICLRQASQHCRAPLLILNPPGAVYPPVVPRPADPPQCMMCGAPDGGV